MAVDMEEFAAQVRSAMESGDPEKMSRLLHPDVHWGPAAEPDWGCRNRNEVASWYLRARDEGARATVSEMVVGRKRLVVGLRVTGTPATEESGGTVLRWQVMTTRDGLVADIRGFGDRDEALEVLSV